MTVVMMMQDRKEARNGIEIVSYVRVCVCVSV